MFVVWIFFEPRGNKSKRNALQAAEDFLEEKSVNEDFFGQTATDVAGLSGRKVVCQFA